MFAMIGLQQQGTTLWYLIYIWLQSVLKIGGGRWLLYSGGQMSILLSDLIWPKQRKYFWSAIWNAMAYIAPLMKHTHAHTNLTGRFITIDQNLKSKWTKTWCRTQFKDLSSHAATINSAGAKRGILSRYTAAATRYDQAMLYQCYNFLQMHTHTYFVVIYCKFILAILILLGSYD